jgi:polar amino acid transport system substrate-binding protein
LIVVLCGVGDVFAGASPTLSRIIERGELRVGMSGNQPPFVMKDREGNLMGFEVELAGAVADAMGVKLKLITRPFGQLLPGLQGGDVDMVMSGVTMTPERNMQFAFIGPYFISGKAVLTKSQTLAQVQDAQNFDQENLTLVALAGSTSEQFVKDVLPKARLTTVDDYDIAVQMVRDDKVQAMVADRPICVISVLRHPNSGLTTTATPLTLEPIGVAVPPDDPLFVNFMTNLFGAIEVTGGFELLTEKWFENSGWLAAMP